MATVVQGIPASWDSTIASIRFPSEICAVVWSPCSRFIAIAHDEEPEITILDAVTLQKLHTMYPSKQKTIWSHIIFSPGSHLLTAYSQHKDCIINWDLQTGGLLSNISTKEHGLCNSTTYSECETMIGSLFGMTIIIHNILSGLCIYSHSTQQSIVKTIWTHDKYLQFATVEPESITMWQISFPSSHEPMKVGSLSTPDNFNSYELVLLPTLSRFAFILGGEVLVWDAKHHQVLLHSADVVNPRALSFSPNGRFFVCGTENNEVCVWKESAAGYLSCQQFISGYDETTPLISPSGESILLPSENVLQLWHTTSCLPTLSMHTSEGLWFFIEFSPDETLVAVTERLSCSVAVLETKSGKPWLIIDTGTKACGLRMTEDKIIVVGDGQIVTWGLPGRNCAFNKRNISDSIQTTIFRHSVPVESLIASISPNLNYVAFQGVEDYSGDLYIYNTHSGVQLVRIEADGGFPGFTPDSCVVWCAKIDDQVLHWEIVEENGSNIIYLEKLGEYVKLLSGLPWLSPDGHQVSNDGWVVCSNGKHLLWLPHQWRQDLKMQRKWNGKFLAVWNLNSTEPFILKLEV